MTPEYEEWQIFNSPGECPVAAGVRGQTHLANETRHQAEERPPYAISALAWDLGLDRPVRIIAYRVLKDPKPFEPDWYMAQIHATRLAVTAGGPTPDATATRCHFAALADTLGYDIVKREVGK